MSTEEIAYAVGKTKRLVKEYEKIIDEYKERNYIIEALLNFEVNSETKLESDINEIINYSS